MLCVEVGIFSWLGDVMTGPYVICDDVTYSSFQSYYFSYEVAPRDDAEEGSSEEVSPSVLFGSAVNKYSVYLDIKAV